MATAAKLEAASIETSESRLSLQELREAADAAGIDPKWVDAALETSKRPKPAGTHWGIPLGVERTVVIPGEVDEDLWGRMVQTIRSRLNQKGTVESIGRTHRWSNNQREVIVEPAGENTVIHVRNDWSGAVKVFSWMSIGFAGGAGLFGLLGYLLEPEVLITAGIFATVALVYSLVAWVVYPAQKKTAERKVDALAEELTDLAVGPTRSPAAYRAPAEPAEEGAGILTDTDGFSSAEDSETRNRVRTT